MVLSSAIVCDHDRRIADDRRSSFHMIADDRRPYCDLRSAICDPRSYGNQPLDRTWFYLLRHDRRIADDRRPYCDLRSAITWKPAFSRARKLIFFFFFHYGTVQGRGGREVGYLEKTVCTWKQDL